MPMDPEPWSLSELKTRTLRVTLNLRGWVRNVWNHRSIPFDDATGKFDDAATFTANAKCSFVDAPVPIRVFSPTAFIPRRARRWHDGNYSLGTHDQPVLSRMCLTVRSDDERGRGPDNDSTESRRGREENLPPPVHPPA